MRLIPDRLRRHGARGLARELVHRALVRLPVERFPGGWAPPIYSLAFWLTDSCNLRCSMCWVSPTHTDVLHLEDWLRLATEVSRWHPRITLTGGEPTLLRDLLPLIAGIKRNRLYVSLNTNGWRLEEVARELVESGLDDIAVSLDGLSSVHDRIRGREGSWMRAAAGLREMVRVREGRRRPVVRVTTVLDDRNIGDLLALNAELSTLGVDCHTVQHRWFLTAEQHRRNCLEVKERLGTTGDGVAGLVWAPAPPHDLIPVLRALRTAPFPTRVEQSPHLTDEEILSWYRDPDVALRRSCRSRWFRLTVLPDGRVTPCLGFVAGSVRERRLDEIWNGPELRRFRRELFRSGSFPACHRCCGLFSDQP